LGAEMQTRRRKAEELPHHIYFERAEELFGAAEKQIGRLVPHSGEQGKLLEEFLRNFLRRVLPDRYSIGTGLVIDSTGRYGSQTDIVVYDRFYNSQLLSEYSSVLFPIECVYAVVEVKKTLRRRDIAKCLRDIAKIRQMAQTKKYLAYQVADKPRGLQVATPGYVEDSLSPRSFVFSYSSEFATIESARSVIEGQLKSTESFVHGVYIADKRWLVSQKPSREEIIVKSRSRSNFGYFCMALLDSINSVPVSAAYLEPYFHSSRR